MTKMRYKNFVFNVNPSDIKLSFKKNIAKANVMYSNQACSEVGENAAVISGKGCFIGDDAEKKAFELMRIYNKQGADFLFTPYSSPVLAIFSFESGLTVPEIYPIRATAGGWSTALNLPSRASEKRRALNLATPMPRRAKTSLTLPTGLKFLLTK